MAVALTSAALEEGPGPRCRMGIAGSLSSGAGEGARNAGGAEGGGARAGGAAQPPQRREWGGGCSVRFLGGSQPGARTCPLLALAVLVAAGEELGKGGEEGAGRPFEARRGLGRPSGEVSWRQPGSFCQLSPTHPGLGAI